MEVKKVVVIGAGIMGSGIVLTVAQAGIEVINIDVSKEQLEKAKEKVAANLNKLLSKDKLAKETVDGILCRLNYSIALKMSGVLM